MLNTTGETEMETTIYSHSGITVVSTEDPGLNAEAFLGVPVSDPNGVVYFDVIDRDGHTVSALAAPMFDVALRTEAATEAIRQADELAD